MINIFFLKICANLLKKRGFLILNKSFKYYIKKLFKSYRELLNYGQFFIMNYVNTLKNQTFSKVL